MVCSFVEWTVEWPHGVRMHLPLDVASGVGIDNCVVLSPSSLLSCFILVRMVNLSRNIDGVRMHQMVRLEWELTFVPFSPQFLFWYRWGWLFFCFFCSKCFLSIVTLSFYHFVILLFCLFLVACYATLHPAMSVGRSIGWSVGRSVGRLVGRSVSPLLTFSAFLSFLIKQLLPRCPSDLQHCSCPPARD